MAKRKKYTQAPSTSPEELLNEELLDEEEEEEELGNFGELLDDSVQEINEILEELVEELPVEEVTPVVVTTQDIIIEEITSYFTDIPKDVDLRKAANRLYEIGVLRGTIDQGAQRILGFDQYLTKGQLVLYLEKTLDYLLKTLKNKR